MKPRTLLVLLVLVAGLGAFIWFVEREQPGSEERERLARRVLGVEREEVAKVELQRGDRTIALVRTEKEGEDGADQDQWRLAQPLDFPADYWQADGLVRTLASLERKRTLEDFEPAEVGLEEPRGRVVVELESGARRALVIGAEVPASGDLIVAIEGEDTASVVPGALWESLEQDTDAWRDKDLFAAERDDIRAITLERFAALGETAGAGVARASPDAAEAAQPSPPSGSVELVRLERDPASRGDFLLAAPVRDRADEDAVNALLRELTGLTASEFLDHPETTSELGLDPPRARITVELEEGEPFVLSWGAPREEDGETFAQAGELVVATTAALDEPLARTPRQWRSKALSTLPVYDVDEVTVADATGSFTLIREEGSWREDDLLLEQGAVTDFLYDLDDAVAERVADAAEEPVSGAPELTVTMLTRQPAGTEPTGGKPSREQERLELFAATSENLVPARTSGREAILLLPRATRDDLLTKLQAVRDAIVAAEEVAASAPPEPEGSVED